MTHPVTVLVLTPSMGGHYFGELLVGLCREVAGVGGRLVVIQTLLAAAPRDEPGEPGGFATPVAWSQIDGVVSITTAVGAPYLQRLRNDGKPVVLSSAKMADFHAPVALPDNDRGTFAAVEHLIGHGHTRIGFVGNLAQQDIRDRFAAYQRALETHGLTADPALMFAAPENAETGGVVAARSLLESYPRPTALMVATDRNAIGLMRTLIDAGVAIPADLAIVAVDNIEAGALSTPTLSSVNQRFDEVGALAGRLILAKMRGDVVPMTNSTSQSVLLALRESCGCAADAHGGEVEEAASSPDASPELLSDRLQEVLCGALLTGDRFVDGPLHDAVRATVRDAMHLLESGDDVTTEQIQTLTTSLQRLTPRPETLHRFGDAIADYAQRVRTSVPTTGRKLSASTRLAAALWKVRAGAFLRRAETTETAIVEQYVVDAGLLDTGHSDPRDLRWLTGTHVKAGVLALWQDGPSCGRLQIVGTYDSAKTLPDLVGAVMPTEHFPPEPLIAQAVATDREVCVVVPVSTPERDWGLLAVVSEIDTTTARGTYQHWAALLCASLESQRLQETVRKNALYDAVTGLPNRQFFLIQLEQAIAQWQRSRTPFAVLFLDLDGFKLINDSLGHQMGDRVLTGVGSRILRELRSVDTGARFGGDEFVILLADTDPGGAAVVAHRVQAALADVHDVDGHQIATQASIGIATSDIEYASAEDVLRDADAAMYHAKSAEPGTVAFFGAAMHATTLSEQSLLREIHRALHENQFEVHYQPIVNLTSGRADRFEALVRWRHPERGLVLPAEFLPVMEETGLIVQLGHQVLTEVCRQLVAWGPGVVNVSVNVSDGEFWRQDLLTHVLETLRAHDLAAGRLTLEITEAVLMRRPEVALRMMRKMHDAGLRLHIDEFGTGYSSLQTLHRFPVDAFKIDRSFIHSMTSAVDSAELVRALVALGKALGLAVVAEGVETCEQLTSLQEIGCATGQGYLFMPAVTGDRAADLLGSSLCAERPDVATAQSIRLVPPSVGV
ncbi:MAG: EAL domain-containing protein [Propionibacteriaceae bacterium]